MDRQQTLTEGGSSEGIRIEKPFNKRTSCVHAETHICGGQVRELGEGLKVDALEFCTQTICVTKQTNTSTQSRAVGGGVASTQVVLITIKGGEKNYVGGNGCKKK